MKIYYYPERSDRLCISEFGHSTPEEQQVGPRIRTTYLLHFIIKGRGTFCSLPFYKGDAFLIMPGEVHDFSFLQKAEHYWFAFSGKQVEMIFKLTDIPVSQGIYRINNQEQIFYLLSESFKRAPENNFAPFYVLMGCIFSLVQKGTTVPFISRSQYCDIGIDMMLKSVENGMSLKNISKKIGITEKYFYKLFNEKYHTCPKKFLIEQKMSRSCELLKGTDLKIDIIAESVGYQSTAAFSRQFKKYFGVSPNYYRKNRGN